MKKIVKLTESDLINIVKRVINEDEGKKKSVKDILFNYWDENGPSMEMGEFLSLSDSDTANYLYEYYGEGVEDVVEKNVKYLIDNYHSCGGDEFNLRFDNITFNTKEYPQYNVIFSIDYNSEVFNGFDFEDHENLITLYGQIEECVENMLNDKLYETYGIVSQYSMVNGIYGSNI